MKPTFIITSAIDTNVGVYSPEIRLLQTHETLNSLQKFYPDAIFVLVEGGRHIADFDPTNTQVAQSELSLLWSRLKSRCHYVLNMSNNDQIKHLHNNFLNNMNYKNEMGGTTGLTKTVAELTLMAAALNALSTQEKLKPALEVDRIFKISGRYQLSPLHDPAVYAVDQFKDKIIFKQREASWMTDALNTIGTDHSFCSRLWSFPVSRYDEVMEKFNSMIEDCLETSNKHYIDMEHLLFKHLHAADTAELDYLHLMGTIAPNGIVTYD